MNGITFWQHFFHAALVCPCELFYKRALVFVLAVMGHQASAQGGLTGAL
ncbi:hypothetical protein [Vandammella animalimorsus]|nr:hypothetical protein [Vandammella animalimorsus]